MSQRIEFPASRHERLDVLLSEQADVTRSRAAALIREGRATVAGEIPSKAGHMVRAGEPVVLEIPDPAPARAEAQDIAIEVLYQDDLQKLKQVLLFEAEAYKESGDSEKAKSYRQKAQKL